VRTTYWGLQEYSGPGYSYMYAVGQFVLTFAGLPSGYVQANYNIQTGEVTVDYSSGLTASCPAVNQTDVATASSKWTELLNSLI
jgi:hypothetical protein